MPGREAQAAFGAMQRESAEVKTMVVSTRGAPPPYVDLATLPRQTRLVPWACETRFFSLTRAQDSGTQPSTSQNEHGEERAYEQPQAQPDARIQDMTPALTPPRAP